MLRRQQRLRRTANEIADVVLFGAALWLAHTFRVATGDWHLWAKLGGSVAIQPFSEFIWLYAVIVPFSPLVMDFVGFYNRPVIAARRDTAWRLFRACVLGTIGLILVLFLFQMNLARAVIILFGMISFALVMTKELVVRTWIEGKLGAAKTCHRVLLLGTPEDTRRLRSEFRSRKVRDVEVAGELDINTTPATTLTERLHEINPNGVILSATHTFFGQIEKAIEVCEREGVEVWLMADFFKTQISRTTVDEFYGRPMIVFRSTPEESWQKVGKNLIDFSGALSLLVLITFIIPIIPFVALAVKLSSPGPILFRQRRSGLNGQPFEMLKFRTMVSNAEQLKQELERFNEMSGPVFKVTNDPRITPTGRFLRKYSLDELPQLWNVLRGEMSLVGPRPLPVDEVARFDDPSDRRRLSVKPGLTCLWQVGGRNEVSDFKEWVRLDLEYIDNWSLWLDIKILIKTIPAVFAGSGAK